MLKNEIAIIGGGIGGLAAAIALQRTGANVTVFEQAAQFSELGAGITLGPNAWRALNAIDPALVTRLEGIAQFPDGIEIRDGVSNRLLRTGSVTNARELFGAPYGTCHRSSLHAALAQACTGKIQILHSQRIEAISQTPNMVNLTIGSEQRSFDALIGADGVRSIVRQQLDPSALAATPSTLLCVRAMVRPEALSPANRVLIWWAPGMHVVCYPVSASETNVVGFVKAPNLTAALDKLRAGFDKTALAALFRGKAEFTAWPLWVQPATPCWQRERVALLGDAAHASLPFLAQGAAMALEDAAALGQALNGAQDLRHGLRAYVNARKTRAAKVQAQSARMQQVDHASGLVRWGRNTVLRGIQTFKPQASVLAPLAWIYRSA